MKLAIMQPYFLPYIGYWQLLSMVDMFVVYDNIQYTKKGWINRNNILLNNKSFLFSLPLKKDKDFLNVNERYLSVDSSVNTAKVLRQIENSYKKAPFFHNAFPLVESIFENENKNLFDYIYESMLSICHYLDIQTDIVISSSIDIDHSLKGQEKVISISKELGADIYINPNGGMDLYKREVFKQKGIDLNFIIPDLKEYQQYNENFIPNLSILDVIMFNSVDEVKNKLTEYNILYR